MIYSSDSPYINVPTIIACARCRAESKSTDWIFVHWHPMVMFQCPVCNKKESVQRLRAYNGYCQGDTKNEEKQ